MKHLRAIVLATLMMLLVSMAVVQSVQAASQGTHPNVMRRYNSVPGLYSLPVGYAYSDYVSVPAGSSGVSVGPFTTDWLACTIHSTQVSNSGASTSLSTYGSTGATQSTITPSSTSTQDILQTVANINNLHLLGGLITANTVKGVANSYLSASSSKSDGSGSIFSGLMVSGKSMPTNPAPNTTLSLPGIGSVTLNKQNNFLNKPNVTGMVVDMIDIHITLANTFGLPVGSDITIGHTYSYIVKTVAPLVGSSIARSLYADNLTGSLAFSPGALAEASCGGDTVNTSTAGITSPILTTGATTASAHVVIGSSLSIATSVTTVANLNLLHGLIKANAITSSAQASTNNGGSTTGYATFTGASINGNTFQGTPYPNSYITLPGLGYLILNEQYGNSTGFETYAIDLYVTTANTLGLPIGARIMVGRVHAGITNN